MVDFKRPDSVLGFRCDSLLEVTATRPPDRQPVFSGAERYQLSDCTLDDFLSICGQFQIVRNAEAIIYTPLQVSY